MALDGGKPVKSYAYDVKTKKWAPMPRYNVGPDGNLDIEITGLGSYATNHVSLTYNLFSVVF